MAPIIVIGALGFGIDLIARRLFTARRHSVGRRSAGRNILPETALGPTSDRVQSKRPRCRLSSPAQEGTEPDSATDPNLDKINLATTEAIIHASTTYSALEDNVARGQFADDLVQLLAERMALDIEEQHLQGDEDAAPSGDAFLDQNDGILALADTEIDGTTLADRTDVLESFDAAWKGLPRRFKGGSRKDWRY
ncbi:MAG: hypothetical protein ACRDGB_05655, partial [Candidatus Limnocylindria bacterium]